MSPDGNEALIAELRRRGLNAPARLLLDAHRPLRPLLANAVTFLSPLSRPLLGARLDAVERALSDDDAYDRLVRGLDEPETTA
jgi:hypothetical protein